ncbi:hypothetical protein [Nocardioides antri]|uniref:Uncharacterized protein n=1 Tax=Nocardioides antri TaxID=2607659 RepID=A0A5B1M760_9ACTN|nr:hypothetical protein [Nocardioides antri]KAA1427879.1 hypothetical protein F0U47_10705 [Nocardioides antri]
MIGLRTEWLGPPRVRAALLAALVGAGLVPVLDRDMPWLGSWKVALDQGTFSITTLGPVAAGIACSVYVRIRRSEVPELLAQARRPWLGWLAPGIGVWGLASLAVVLICAFTTTVTWAIGAHAYPDLFWVVPPALAVLAAEVAIGALIGSQVQHHWATPWAAVIVFMVYILSSVGVLPGVFRTGGVTGTLAGQTFHAPTFAWQALAGVGLAGGAMALSRWELFRVSGPVSRGATGLALVGAVVAMFQLRGDSDERYVFAATVQYECREGEPTVCMLLETTRPLDDLSAKMRSLSDHLEAAGAQLPEQFRQRVPGEPDPHHGFLRMRGDAVLAATVDYLTAAESLAQPAGCSAYSSDDPRVLPEVWFTVDDVLVRWLLVQEGHETAPSDGALADWWALPRARQWPWVRATYDALRDCRLHALRLPTSAS